MAVKVMVAAAIAKGDVREERNGVAPAVAPKSRRRRSSVYDCDGNEVFITLMCLKCHKMRPLSQFGLRKMADGAIRNQPWCRSCRSSAGEKPRGRGAARNVDASAATAPLVPVDSPAVAPEKPVSAAQVAAQVAAALAGGRPR
jgi:hypothetical protein